MTFSAGDKIRQKEDCCGTIAGEIYELTWGDKKGECLQHLFAWKGGNLEKDCLGSPGCSCQGKWELVEPAKEVIIHTPFQEKYNQVVQKVSLKVSEEAKAISEPAKETKRMNIIKNIFKSTEQKALAHYEITNGDGGLSDIGRAEFIDYLWETLAERKDFIAKIVEEYKNEKKEK